MNNKGGGLAVIIIVLAVVCIVFLAAGFLLLSSWGGIEWWNEFPDRMKNVEEYSISQIQEAEIDGIDKFEFRSVSADMNVVFADTDTVTVELIGSYRSARGKVELKKEKIGDTVKIYVDYPRLSGIFSWNETELTITMPKDMDDRKLVYTSVSGDVDIATGLEVREVSVNTTSGDVQVSDITCEEFRSGTVSGRLDIKGYVENEIRVETVSGDTDIRIFGRTEYIDVDSVSGDVDIFLEDNMEFKFNFDTVSGDFDCEFPVYAQGGKNDRNGYTDENADLDIDINTVSGDLRIRH